MGISSQSKVNFRKYENVAISGDTICKDNQSIVPIINKRQSFNEITEEEERVLWIRPMVKYKVMGG